METHNIANTIFRFVYRRKRAREPGTRKPRLAWFPKYAFLVRPSDDILGSDEPEQVLESLLASLGFSLDYWNRDGIHFARGKSWGDFSIRLVRLHLAVSLPLQAETRVMLEVADVCLFDTGDLWSLTRELQTLFDDDRTSFEERLRYPSEES